MSERRVLTIPEAGELGGLDLTAFPAAESFRVALLDARSLGQHLHFTDARGTTLASFPWWDHVETRLKTWTEANVPLGTRARPFDALEQGWQIHIFEEHGWVYVLEGSEPCCVAFERWFRVEKGQYLDAWRHVLAEVRDDRRNAASLEEALEHPTEVRRLSFVSRTIGVLPAAIARLTHLEHLDVARCGLTELPEEIGALRALRRLDADFNRLTHLPRALFDLPELRRLALSYNALTELPPAIGKLRTLESFCACSNHFTTLPEELFELPALRELIITDCPLRALPPRLRRSPSLTHLNLGANELSEADRARVREAYAEIHTHVE